MPSFGEEQEGDAHAHRGRRHGRNAQFAAAGKGLAPDVQDEEIEAVDEKVRALQEVIEILRRHAGGKFRDLGIRD